MPSIFSRLKGRDGSIRAKNKKGGNHDQFTNQAPAKPKWEDAYLRKTVEPEEIYELTARCTEELKARALDLPFLLLPFRPTSDPSAVRTFVRHFFDNAANMKGEVLAQELRLTEPMVLSGVIKWCWSRLQGGVVGWDAYELFKVGESDSSMARDSFKTFIPLSVENEARSRIITDFFNLLSAIAAHGKSNGFGGRKLSRMASWWAFEQGDMGDGFEGGYKAWLSAADATSHLFFAYLRSLAPAPSLGGIAMLPMSLQKLLQETEYPPQRPSLMQSSTYKVVMIVDAVSPTPFTLLRRGNHFQYRDEDKALRDFSEYEDPINALTEECRRVLKAISAANQTQAVSSSKHSTSLRDASWSRFEDIGFTTTLEEEDESDEAAAAGRKAQPLRTTPASGGNNAGRPTTPSWADFLSSGFVDDGTNKPQNLLLPPDKVLPPIDITVRQRSSQSHRPRLESDRQLEPGELASISKLDLDDSFWWVWMSSLAPEETAERKAAFGRCAIIETVIRGGRWLVWEEMVKGAAPEPIPGAYIAEKKGFFSWTRRNKGGVSRSKSSTGKHGLEKGTAKSSSTMGLSRTSIGPDQQAKIQKAARQLQARQVQEDRMAKAAAQERRGRNDPEGMVAEKTNSVVALQPVIMTEASQAMKWASKYDKDTIREAYLSNSNAGRGVSPAAPTNGHAAAAAATTSNKGARPEVPAKDNNRLVLGASAVNLPLPTTPQGERENVLGKTLSAPAEVRPAEPAGGRLTPLPPVPQERASVEAAGDSIIPSDDPELSPNSKRQLKKLQKEEKKAAGGGSGSGGGGLKKLFSRKNRASKLPEDASARLNGMMIAAQSPTTEPAGGAVRPAPISEREEMAPGGGEEPAYEPSVRESMSRIDTADAAEAHHEFSRFDQGPLAEQPAFAPEDSVPIEEEEEEEGGGEDDDDDATPPPIARKRAPSPAPAPDVPTAVVAKTTTPRLPAAAIEAPRAEALDRWAQIRKNAAERAAQRQIEEQSRAAVSKTTTTDGDDDTSGEETIESRVARIKARVAELTGNMEGTNGPGSPARR